MSYFCCDKTCNYLHDTHITPHPPPIHPVQSHWHLPLPAPALVNDSLVLHLILLIYLSAHRFPQPTLFLLVFIFLHLPLHFIPCSQIHFTLFCSHFLSEYVFPSVLPTKELSGTHKNTVSGTDRKNSSQHDQHFSHCVRHWQG